MMPYYRRSTTLKGLILPIIGCVAVALDPGLEVGVPRLGICHLQYDTTAAIVLADSSKSFWWGPKSVTRHEIQFLA